MYWQPLKHVPFSVYYLGNEQEGKCPIVTGPGICADFCSSDEFCPRRQKCCSNGCGHVCMEPPRNIQAVPGTCMIVLFF